MSNALDDFLIELFPTWGLNRLRAKMVASELRKYEGASRGDRLSGWVTQGTDANSEIANSLPILRNRVRDLVRNDGYAKKGVGVICRNVIGKGITAEIKGGTTGKRNKLKADWDAWANSKNCDADGKLTLSGIQRLVIRTIVESGEVLIRRRKRQRNDGTVMPFQLQVLEPDHLDVSKDGVLTSGNRILQGIEFDSIGRVVAYHLYNAHPGDNSIYVNNFTSTRVDASEIAHVYRIDRPGQIRGVPWAAPVIIKIKDFNEFEDAQLVRQKIAACFSGFIYQADPTASLSGLPTAKDGKTRVDKLAPGTFSYLKPGEQITFANPPGVQNYKEYTTEIKQRIAAGMEVPYELLTGDLSQVNFSSARMGWIEFQNCVDVWQDDLFIGGFLQDVWKWFIEGSTIKGSISATDSEIYWPDFTPPMREMIDPSREVSAIISKIRAGLISRPKAIKEIGYDPEEITAEIAADNKLLDKDKIILDSDPRYTSNSGQFQQFSSDIVGNSPDGDNIEE